MIKDINKLYVENRAFWEKDNNSEGFGWVNCNDAESGVLSFVRYGHNKADTIVVVCHFTPVTRSNYRVGLPHGGRCKEMLNTNAAEYGGSGVGNFGEVSAQEIAYDDLPFSAEMTLPGLSTTWFKWDGL